MNRFATDLTHKKNDTGEMPADMNQGSVTLVLFVLMWP